MSALVLLSILWHSTALSRGAPVQERDRPIQVLGNGYVSSDQCRTCHQQNHASWHASYHRTMTQVATPEALAVPIDQVELELHGQSYHLRREGNRLWAEMPHPTEGRVEKRIVLTTGSHHFQMYWFSSGKSRKLELFPFVYSIEERRWIPEKSTFLMPPSQQVSTQPGRWNQACLQCHVTLGRPRVVTQDSMDTQVAEFGIACEACHGPGERHVEIMSRPGSLEAYRSGKLKLDIVNPEKLSHRRSSQVCGQCHSVFTFQDQKELVHWVNHGFSYRPGEDLTDSRFLIRYHQSREAPQMKTYLKAQPRFLESVFWSDGMVRTAGREYSGLLESGCYQKGQMSCLSCHRLHKTREDPRSLRSWANDQLQPGMDTNQACLQCHPSFQAVLENHTHHRPGSSGSECYNCHMPPTAYALLKAIRSHQISSPTVTTSLKTGRPNACNQCHLDKPLLWTAEYLQKWYGIPKPKLSKEEKTFAASVLWTLKGDAGQRALMAWSLGWEPARAASGSVWMAPFLAQLLEDPYDAVRFIAYRSLRSLPEFQDFQYDFVDSPGRRAVAHRTALETWRRAGHKHRSANGSAVLFDTRGNLRRDLFDRLLSQRNDYPLGLAE